MLCKVRRIQLVPLSPLMFESSACVARAMDSAILQIGMVIYFQETVRSYNYCEPGLSCGMTSRTRATIEPLLPVLLALVGSLVNRWSCRFCRVQIFIDYEIMLQSSHMRLSYLYCTYIWCFKPTNETWCSPRASSTPNMHLKSKLLFLPGPGLNTLYKALLFFCV